MSVVIKAKICLTAKKATTYLPGPLSLPAGRNCCGEQPAQNPGAPGGPAGPIVPLGPVKIFRIGG